MERYVLVEDIIATTTFENADADVQELFDDEIFELKGGDLVVARDIDSESYVIYDSGDVIAEGLSLEETEEQQEAEGGDIYEIVEYHH